MRYLSVCSGIEAVTQAWHPLGFTPVAFSEVAPFPCAVLHHHYPHVPNWGDMTRFKDWPDATFDVLVGGTPCQSFSVAGLRLGLADPRGNLALTFLAIADRYRPHWLVWENVPGVLSSTTHVAPDPPPPPDDVDPHTLEYLVEDDYDATEDHAFACLLAGLSELRYGFAYASCDAQYFHLAQRRERVFVVGCLGGANRAAAVLLDPTCLRGDPPPRRGPQQDDPTSPQDGAPERRGLPELVGALNDGAHNGNGHNGQDAYTGRIFPVPGSPISFGTKDHGGDALDNLSPPLRAGTHHHSHSNGGVMPAVAFADLADPIAANQQRTYTREGTHNFRLSNVAHTDYQVRRLTPRECERLQGFPDDYTLIPYRGKLAADAPRYKALGNSMAVPVIHWLGQQLLHVHQLP